MVTVVDYKPCESSEGKQFYSLVLEGDLEMVQSKQTGDFYATCRHCTVTSTFDEATCKKLVGKHIPGCIERVESDPYDYTIPETGEVIQLTHSYKYVPAEHTTATHSTTVGQLLGMN